MLKPIRIDDTDLVVSRLSFGTGSLHHLPRRSERRSLLAAALDAGVTHFDTSPLYGFGLAEEDLGAVLGHRAGEITIASKFGLYPPLGSRPSATSVWHRKLGGRALPELTRPVVDWSLERAEASLASSLRRCRRDAIDLLMLHEPDARAIDSDALLAWLEARKKAGQIRHFGIAGETETMRAWASAQVPLARVVQTRDTLSGRDADFLLEAGRPLQFTYGYSSALAPEQRSGALYGEMLARNVTGSIIVSTRRQERIQDIATALAS